MNRVQCTSQHVLKQYVNMPDGRRLQRGVMSIASALGVKAGSSLDIPQNGCTILFGSLWQPHLISIFSLISMPTMMNHD